MIRTAKQTVRRTLIRGILCLTVMLSTTVPAGQLDSLEVDSTATIIKPEQTIIIPSNESVGSDIYVSGRSFLHIDFSVEAQKQVTLLVITGAQKQAMEAGNPIGRPRVRTPIDGTATQSVTVDPGGYYVAILNNNAESVSVTYRVYAYAF